MVISTVMLIEKYYSSGSQAWICIRIIRVLCENTEVQVLGYFNRAWVPIVFIDFWVILIHTKFENYPTTGMLSKSLLFVGNQVTDENLRGKRI